LYVIKIYSLCFVTIRILQFEIVFIPEKSQQATEP